MTEPRQTKLREGDEVELAMDEFPDFVAKGKVRQDSQGCCLALGPWSLMTNGESALQPTWHLTITKLVPRPYYVNHEREEPVENDVCRDAVSANRTTYVYSGGRWWLIKDGSFAVAAALPESRILLVDGDVGLFPDRPALPQRLAEPELSGMAQDPHRAGHGPPSRSPFN